MLTQRDIMVLGDFPSSADIEQGGSQFKDRASRFMFALIASSDISWANMSFIHFWKNESNFETNPTGSKANHEAFKKHIDIIKPKVIVLLGTNISTLFGIDGKIDKYRGSVMEITYDDQPYWMIPTYSQIVLSDNRWKTIGKGTATRAVFFQNDIRKATVIASSGWGIPEERFNLEPTIDEIEYFADMVCKDKRLLYGDIEGTGLNTTLSKTVVLGLAWSESDAIVIPRFGLDEKPYFDNPADSIRCDQAIQKIFNKSGGIIWQNGANYDIKVLENSINNFDYPLSAFKGDTMLLHHTVNPELPHDIGFMNSIYGKIPYWKESFITKKVSIFKTDQLEMRRYNARDCTAMVPIYTALLKECTSKGLNNLYEDAKKLSPIVYRMSKVGLNLNQNNLHKLQSWLDIELKDKENVFRTLGDIPTELNLSSEQDMRTVWFQEQSNKVNKLLADEWKYTDWNQYRGQCPVCSTEKWLTQDESKLVEEDNRFLNNSPVTSKCRKCKEQTWHKVTTFREGTLKKKTSTAYQKIISAKAISKYEPPFILTAFECRTTDGGDKQINNKFRETYGNALIQRQDEITKLKAYQDVSNSRYEKYHEQYKNIENLLSMLHAYNEYAGIKKLKDTYYYWKTGKDGRVHSDFLVTGTKTGRFSSKQPNLFTFPSERKAPLFRQIFTPKEGHVFLSCDYKGLENFVLAFVSKDRKLLEICLDKDRDLHSENTKALFGIDESHPQWTIFRKAAKTFQFGTAYGGSDREIFSQMVSLYPETKLTWSAFRKAKDNFLKNYSGYAIWVDQIVEFANTERYVQTYVNGRKRYLYGNKSSIRKEAMNTPIQGTAADIVNNAMIRIDKRLRQEGLLSELVLYVYDELNYEIPLAELPRVYEIVMEEMTKPVEILGVTRHFRVDAEIGYSLGDLGSFDPVTFETTGGSKH